METIFHEKQEGSLCAQHCLNALLQGAYFTPVDLATLGQKMDDEERMRMAESGVDTDEYRRFLEQPSGNMDDSGYFSVQVINSALDVWGLELVPYESSEPRAVMAQQKPTEMNAYICNYRDHWFTIRRLGHQWFNLNSLLKGPELISDTYLSLFLAQQQQEGYSIFVVFGTLPECTADEVLRLLPVVQSRAAATGQSTAAATDQDPELEAALRMSLCDDEGSVTPVAATTNADLERALQLSLERTQELKLEKEGGDNDDDDDEAKLRKALRLSLGSPTETIDVKDDDDDDEEEIDSELQRAIRLSLEATTPTADVNLVDLRERRIAYLENRMNRQQESGVLHK
ncbi:hypothetical protein LSTR_LSTR002164 [Laodelphax striatellus]|uniref:ubiquitinyl hydrolase 1 n=1 Tax=Laodelphax striatellus TaxID=195883 RepID=A0A482XRL6_LAOST|nr:hypothetical protein LSTR_LSTR002164 [Laodelphax striatellus]